MLHYISTASYRSVCKDNIVSLMRGGFSYYTVHWDGKGWKFGVYIEVKSPLAAHTFVICYTMMRVGLMAARTNLIMKRDPYWEKCSTGYRKTFFFFVKVLVVCIHFL